MSTPYIAGKYLQNIRLVSEKTATYRLWMVILNHNNIFPGLTTKNIFLVDFKEPYAETNLRDETTTNIRGIIFSPKGTYLAYRTDKKWVFDYYFTWV